ncbi:unnamed protein product [Symbiodinium natans]|uniref:Uncharacterized protein n=1 Tax=Symbiodinium natans TaxID=878477 RepID=A0A812G6X3_9DINO|nr:unnamed protein product [Symbiodinium natans]
MEERLQRQSPLHPGNEVMEPVARPLSASSATAPGAQAGQPTPTTPQHYDWLRELPQGQLADIRRCDSPLAARSLLAASCGAPRGVLKELGRQTRATMDKVFALEESIRKEQDEHQAKLEALRADHRVEKRRGKLRLLARYAPHGAAAREALRCEAALPPEFHESEPPSRRSHAATRTPPRSWE